MPTMEELLVASRHIIRSRARTPRYWSSGERLIRAWTGATLRTNTEFHIAAGIDLGGIIDWLYDEGVDAGEFAAEALVGLTRRFQEMVDLDSAAYKVQRLEKEGLPPDVSTEEATCAIIAVLTTQGTAAFIRRGSADLASRWHQLWADFMWRQNIQQQRICAIGLLPRMTPNARRLAMDVLDLHPEDLLPRATSFSEGIEEFLLHYGETSAGSVALLGSLPFAELPLEEVEGLLEMCSTPEGLLTPMAGLLRLAPDVSFDPAEPLNTGVFATAAEQRRNLLDVIKEGKFSPPVMSARLREEWFRYSSRMRDELLIQLLSYGKGAGTHTAGTLLQALFRLLEVLVPGTWKQGLTG
jgi:hypothetical protein